MKESQDIFDNQTKVLEKVGEEASGLMSSAKDELISGLGDIDKKVISMSQTVQTELEAFREQYQQNLTNYFSQQNTLLEESLGKQRDGLNGVVENFRKVFESEYQTRHNLLQELTAQHTELQKSAKTIEQVAKAIGLNEASKMAELQDAARTMVERLDSLNWSTQKRQLRLMMLPKTYLKQWMNISQERTKVLKASLVILIQQQVLFITSYRKLQVI